MAACGHPPVSTPTHAIRGQDALANQKIGILASINVVGHNREIDPRPQCFAEHVNQSGFAAAHRSGYANPKSIFGSIHRLKEKIALRQRQNAGPVRKSASLHWRALRKFRGRLQCAAWPSCESCSPCRCCGSFGPRPGACEAPGVPLAEATPRKRTWMRWLAGQGRRPQTWAGTRPVAGSGWTHWHRPSRSRR